MIILLRDKDSDSRILKYEELFISKNLDYRIVSWDRTNSGSHKSNFLYFHYGCEYANGGIKAIKAKIKWMHFIYKFIADNKDSITCITACDIDTAFPAALAKKRHQLSFTLIFDACDWASALTNNIILRFCFGLMERVAVRQSDELIICEPEREKQIKFKLKKRPYVMRNIPSFADCSFLKKEPKYQFDDNSKLHISYVGWFGNGRFLDELLDCAENGIINLSIAGFGLLYIEKRCELLSALQNVRYYGKVDYLQGLNIMYNSDLIYAMYCKNIPNHKNAAPNKFYESMFLGVPLISNKGINLEQKIKESHCGFLIEESMSELVAFFQTISKSEIEQTSITALASWEKYKNLNRFFIEHNYFSMVCRNLQS